MGVNHRGLQRLILIAALGTLSLAGCKGQDDQVATTARTSSGVGSATVDDAVDFSVTVEPSAAKYVYSIHNTTNTTDWSTACKVNSADAIKDINCIVEAQELDLHYWGVELTYNVPPQMCSYLLFAPTYYYSYAVGDGSSAINYDVDQNGVVGIDANGDGTIAGAEIDKFGATTPALVVMKDHIPACIYDNPTLTGDPTTPNCCTGTYKKTVRTWDSATSAYKATVTNSNKWGGSVASCINGPAVVSQPKDIHGFPKIEYTYVDGTQLRKTYTVKGIMEKATNVFFANFFNPGDHTGGLPAGYKIPSSSDPVAIPNPYYVFECLDRAEEVIARIRVSVREWNTAAEMAKKGSGNPDDNGPETGGIGFGNNDYFDWKDLGNLFPHE